MEYKALRGTITIAQMKHHDMGMPPTQKAARPRDQIATILKLPFCSY